MECRNQTRMRIQRRDAEIAEISAEKTGQRNKDKLSERGRLRSREKTRPQAGVGKLKHAPPRQVAQAVSPASLILGLLLPMCLGAQDADLMTTVWNGVQRAQKEFTSGCGKIVETRTSLLLARPMVFRGKFCAAGMDRFALEYTEPEPVRILFNKDYLNVDR